MGGKKSLCAPQSTAALHLQSIQATDSHRFLIHEPIKTWRFSTLSDGTLDYERNRVLSNGGQKNVLCIRQHISVNLARNLFAGRRMRTGDPNKWQEMTTAVLSLSHTHTHTHTQGTDACTCTQTRMQMHSLYSKKYCKYFVRSIMNHS